MGIFDTTHVREARAKILGVPMEILAKYEETVEKPNMIHAAGIGDKTSLTERLNDPANWIGTDDDNVWMRWRIKIKSWFAFSNRSPNGIAFSFAFLPLMWLFPFTIWFTGWSWWYLFPIMIIPVTRKWRMMPMVLLAVRGKGVWRFEDNQHQFGGAHNYNLLVLRRPEDNGRWNYLSRIQPWCRWHVALHWALLISLHWFWKAEDVLPVMTNQDTDGKVISLYRGWHYDADKTFWGDGAAAGNFK